jgi:hypothetical protein
MPVNQTEILRIVRTLLLAQQLVPGECEHHIRGAKLPLDREEVIRPLPISRVPQYPQYTPLPNS